MPFDDLRGAASHVSLDSEVVRAGPSASPAIAPLTPATATAAAATGGAAGGGGGGQNAVDSRPRRRGRHEHAVRVGGRHEACAALLRDPLLLVDVIATNVVDQHGEMGFAQGTLGLEVDECVVLLEICTALHVNPLLYAWHAKGVQTIT